jgi:phosphatidylglycerophosphatase A
MAHFIVIAATWFGSGFSPIASGTVGTLAAIPLYLLWSGLPLLWYTLLLLPMICFASWISGEAEKIFNKKDSGKIVIDEVVGYLVTMIGVPLTWQGVLLGFLLFRFFDITKIPPARYFDRKVKNGWGVVMDDVVAGGYACLTLHLLLRFL